MKVRTGFVSNSSSSSFIVAFDRDPRNDPAYLKEAVFGGQEYLPDESPGYGSSGEWSVDELVGYLAGVVDEAKPLDYEGVVRALSSMTSYDDARIPDFDAFKVEEKGQPAWRWQTDWRAWEAAREKVVREVVAPEFWAKVGEGQTVLAFEIADEDRIGARLEHGGTFDDLASVRINHH